MKVTREELQKMIDQPDKQASQMREIGQSYLRGDVLKDVVAAESWLMKVIEAEDAKESPLAMALIAKEILGKEQLLSDEDYLEIRKELETTEGEEKEKLERILTFATEKQKGL